MHTIVELPSSANDATALRDHAPEQPDPAAATWTAPADAPRVGPSRATADDRHLRRLSLAAVTIATIGTLFAVQQARDFLLPVVVAILIAGVLKPVVQALARHGWPSGLAAATTILATVVALAAAGYELVGPAAAWVSRVPSAMARLEPKLRWIQAVVASVDRLAARIATMARPAGSGQQVEMQPDSMIWAVLGAGRHVVIGAIIVAVLVYFILSAGDGLVDRWLNVLPPAVDRRRARACVRDIERQISTYLSTVTSINFCLGAAVSFSLWLVGVPNPVLWGVLMAALNFVPYVGAPIAIATIAVVSFLSLDDPLRMVSAPLACVGLSMLETYFVTPVVVGRSLSVSPAAVFLSLAFWTWLWGLPGAIIAVPTLMATRIVFDAVPALAPWGRLLAGRSRGLSTCASASEPGPVS